jgi:hypothetical protein
MTYLRSLDEATKTNMRATLELARTLRDSIGNISLGLGRVEADIIDLRFALEKQARYSAAIREIELSMLEMKFSLVQLQESLDLNSIGKLSSTLINPHNLSQLLQQVNLHLPKATSMLTGLTIEDMYIYYAVASVHATATSRSIRLFIDIPLKAADRYFELYQAHSLPFLHQGIGSFVRIDEPFAYLAVAEDRQFFTEITDKLLDKCTTDFYTICPSNIVLRKSSHENCLIALFTGKTDVALRRCRRVIIEDFEPVWIRSPDAKYWVYSLKEPPHITLKCRPLDGSPHEEDRTIEQTLTNTGVLMNSSTCYVYAETFKLLPHSLGRTLAGLNKAQIVLPNIETILNQNEQRLLQAHLPSRTHPSKVDDVIQEVTRSISRSELDISTVLKNSHSTKTTPTTNIYWISGLSTCILIIILMYCCHHKQFLKQQWNHMKQRARRHDRLH